MASPGGGGALFYSPEPHERPYYDGLFQAADTSRSGTIGGGEAVAFFSRSKLPMEQLKNVWTVADNPPSNSLNRPKFAVAIRLIQLLQNGVKGQGSNLAVPPGTPLRPVFLEGISGAVVPLPGPQPPQQLQQPPAAQGIPPGRGPPQQQQPPPQQHAPPQQQPTSPPAPQQQQQQPPQMSTPGRPPMAPQTPGDGSMALTVQDPYTLVPNERARYESIFPQYAQEDGYIHGKEAVALFSKSGLSQPILRDVWNMADQPVDNRLDKLEFAIAMHLIVCISKKNLPMPKYLPFSLKTLKQQQQQHEHQQQQQQQIPDSPGQQPGMAPPPGQQPGMAPLGPAYNQQQQQQPSMSMPEPPNRMNTPTGDHNAMSGMPGLSQTNSLPGPPPLAQPGGMDISDAFEGLNTGGDGLGGLPPPSSGFGSLGGAGTGVSNEPSYGGHGGATMEPSPTMEPAPAPSGSSPPRIHEAPRQLSMAPPVPEPAPKSSEVLAQSYNMSDNTGELDKMRVVLQKLQAENISLKAQLGTMTEEEKDVQRHLNATVAEIGELSNRLTTLRAQVLAQKSRLLEATAELKAAHEKKGVLNDLIGEAEATKDAIETAYQGIAASANAAQAPPPAPAPFEADLFGFGGAGPAPAPAPQMAPAPSYEAHSGPPQPLGAAPAPFPAPGQPPMPHGQPDYGGAAAPGGQHAIETVSSDDSSAPGDQEGYDEDPQAGMGQQEEMFSYNQPPTNQYQQNPYGGQDMSNAQANPYGQEAPNAHQGITFEQNFRPNPPTHNKQASISSVSSFEAMGPMGGGPVPQNQFAQQHQHHHQEENTFNNDEEVVIATSMEEVNELKMKAKDAGDLARDSEGALRQLMAKADKLRKSADKAEMEARQKVAEATEKKGKGGLLGGGKKKKSMKEATQAKHDAEAKKKQFLAAQAQANDAQAVSMETKREAEKLRKMAEQAEMDAAAAASMQQKQPDPEPVQQQQPPPPAHGYPPQGQEYGQPQGYGQPPQGPPPNQGGYGQPPPGGGFGQPPPPGGGFGQPPPPGGGFGQPPPLGGGFGQPPQFNPSVMGQPSGGGIEIPTPTAGGDPYANPF